MEKRDKVLAGAIVFLTLWWIFNIVISAFAGATEGIIFKHRTGDVSKRFPTQVTPSGFTFMIWNLIFFWILAGYIFLIISIFRQCKDTNSKVFCTPTVFSLPVVITLLLNCAVYTSWLFVWDNEYMTAASVILFLIMGTNWVALGLFSYNLSDNTRNLSERSPWVLNLYRILIQNSLATYTTWTTIASLLNLTIALVHDAEVDEPTPSIIALGVLTAIVGVWTILDVFVLDNFCRYMLSPLCVVTWALIGIFTNLQKKSNDGEGEDVSTVRNFTIGLLGAVAVLLVGRICLTVYRSLTKPLIKETV